MENCLILGVMEEENHEIRSVIIKKFVKEIRRRTRKGREKFATTSKAMKMITTQTRAVVNVIGEEIVFPPQSYT